MGELSKQSVEFLLQDKDQKVNYLNAHFGRMWTRFNFFISIETGLLGFMLLSGGNRWSDKALYFVLAGIVISLLWWVFGAQDRALVQYYRSSVKIATCRITANMPDNPNEDLTYDCHCHYVGNQNEWQPPDRFNPVEWYSKRISITRLAAYFALFAILLWLGLALVVPIPSELICREVACVEADDVLVPEDAADCWRDDNGRTECQAIPGAEVPWERSLTNIRFSLVLLLAAIDVGLMVLAFVRSESESKSTAAKCRQEG